MIFNKQTILALLVALGAYLCTVFSANSQNASKRWEIEVGGGINFAQSNVADADNKIGYSLYTEAKYLFPASHFSVGLQLSQNSFQRKFYGSYQDTPFSLNGDFKSSNILFTGAYQRPLARNIDLILGLGVGIGVVSDSKYAGLYTWEYLTFVTSGGNAFTLVAQPKVGLSIHKHINLQLSYKLQEKINRMALLTVGYAFRL